MATTDVMQLRSAGEEPRQRFDYRGRHRYVITVEAHAGAPVFTQRELVLRVLAVLREQAFQHHFEVHAYSFLPTRLLLLVQGKQDDSYMKGFLSAFRAAANAELEPVLGHPLWRRMYRERVLRKGEETGDAVREIWNTPVRENLARHPDAYEFQGSFVKAMRAGPPGGRRPGRRGNPSGSGARRPYAPRRPR
ncbi:MAG TPA: hypothetical protein VLT13_09365 [Bacteroidota bacterium]|nr:hypothetical protein [Bacteroidota bacterium]